MAPCWGRYRAGSLPLHMTFDGANIWVANHDSSDVTRLRASDGANLGSFKAGPLPMGIAFDGSNVWVANQGDFSDRRGRSVTKLRANDGANSRARHCASNSTSAGSMK